MPAQGDKNTDEHCQNQNGRQLIEQSGHLFFPENWNVEYIWPALALATW